MARSWSAVRMTSASRVRSTASRGPSSTTRSSASPRDTPRGSRSWGTGYRVAQKGNGLEFALGFSHSITVEPPAGITFSVEGNTKLAVHGIDKQQVGEVAANIRKLRKPEPYKGKGVRYAGEVVRRKAGKAGK